MAQTATAVKEETVQNSEETKTQVQSVEFSEAVDTNVKGSGGSLDILLDMNVPVTVTVGRTEIPVRRLLQLAPGSVIRLDKPVEEPVDLYLNESKFAVGSVVVVDGCFAVKIQKIIGLEDSSDK